MESGEEGQFNGQINFLNEWVTDDSEFEGIFFLFLGIFFRFSLAIKNLF